MKLYDFKNIEIKWQERWYNSDAFKAQDFSQKPKYYVLSEFFGPSGTGIHLGHVKCFTPTDIIARYMRFRGYNVLYPAGWDAFGLPTENYAIKTGTHPEIVTKKNIDIFTNQLKKMGYSFDWTRTINTSFKDYYRWTQWIFLQLFKNNMAYKSEGIVNFCPKCITVLSNEDSQGGICDRCHNEVIQEKRSVWYLRMKNYSEKILDGIDNIDMKESLKESQRNWIGKSIGAEIIFDIQNTNQKITVFTTRPDTVFGATFIVIAPEHPIIQKLKDQISNYDELIEYKNNSVKKTLIDRVADKEKTGIKLSCIFAINPLTKKQIPIFVSDYVLMNYGTGAIMAVPAHDQRDYEFAKKFEIDIVEVILGGNISKEAYSGKGKLTNSDFLNDLDTEDAKQKIVDYLEQNNIGHKMINFKMQDWPFNRQRYWGEPFPIILCDSCGCVEIDEKDLPLTLPVTNDFEPNLNGDSPLSKIKEWVSCSCPKCGKLSKRETDTMPNWAGSSWYWLRFMDPDNKNQFVKPDKLEYWGAVDLYTGGVEHVTRHMLYASFWHNFLYDIDLVPNKLPFIRRMCNGLILDQTGKKMSKSSTNAIDPLEIIDQYGADAFRLHMMFIGEYEQNTIWSLDTIAGITRFLNNVWNLQAYVQDENIVSQKHAFGLNILLKKYSKTLLDISKQNNCYEKHNDFKFNTIISAMMIFVNEVKSDKFITKEELKQFLIMLNPFAPHISSEIYENIFCCDIMTEKFPEFDETKIVITVINLPVQINGKLKVVIDVTPDLSEEDILPYALEATKLSKEDIKKVIYKKNKIINLII